MNASKILLALVPVLLATGCVSSKQWSSSGGSREQGVVRLSYQYAEFKKPEVSDAQAGQLAENRCNTWGYAHADAIPGQTRECSESDGGNCTLWTVTREYQCSGDAKMADRGADGAVSSRLSPVRLAR